MNIKSALFGFFLASLLIALIFNCKKESLKSIPTVSLSSVTNITAASATYEGNVTSDGGATITARGLCWSLTIPTPTITDGRINNGTGTGNFTDSITALNPGKTYYLRAYATNSVGTAYSSQVTFTTLAIVPILTSADLSAITSSTASSGGNITSDGGSAVLSRGVCWSTTSGPTTSNSKTSDGSGSGSFISAITGLNPGTTYYFRAYATNNVGTSYGSQIIATTSAVLPLITTSAISTITQTAATCGGNISYDGGAPILARGVCWSINANPTIKDSITNNGTGVGTYTSSIVGLIPGVFYFLRAYATNGAGVTYGNEVTFLTLTADYLPSTAHFYHFIPRSQITWSNASNEAGSDSMKYRGLRGYLATITSEEENSFIIQITKGTAWIGASDHAVEGDWRWVTGPEGLEDSGQGQLFWRGTGAQYASGMSGTGPVVGQYTNWGLGEPNDCCDINIDHQEDYAHLTFFPSNPADSFKWNDATNDVGSFNDYTLAGYIIEYGGMPGDPPITP